MQEKSSKKAFLFNWHSSLRSAEESGVYLLNVLASDETECYELVRGKSIFLRMMRGASAISSELEKEVKNTATWSNMRKQINLKHETVTQRAPCTQQNRQRLNIQLKRLRSCGIYSWSRLHALTSAFKLDQNCWVWCKNAERDIILCKHMDVFFTPRIHLTWSVKFWLWTHDFVPYVFILVKG